MINEAQTQKNLVTWWEAAHKGLGVPDKRLLIMVPNGSYLGGGDKVLRDGRKVPLRAIRMNKLKGQGLITGTPDLFLAVGRIHGSRFYGGLWLELKIKTGGKVSSAQQQMHGLLKASGYSVHVCAGFDAAADCIVSYLAGQRALGMI